MLATWKAVHVSHDRGGRSKRYRGKPCHTVGPYNRTEALGVPVIMHNVVMFHPNH